MALIGSSAINAFHMAELVFLFVLIKAPNIDWLFLQNLTAFLTCSLAHIIYGLEIHNP